MSQSAIAQDVGRSALTSQSVRKIELSPPWVGGHELANIEHAMLSGQLFGEGRFNRSCAAWLRRHTGAVTALMTPSGTHALELAALAADIQPGDEVIMPSFTFVSTANAFALRGAVPVFVDVRADTLNIDERLIQGAITDRTRAIVPVHYAGVSCEMDAIMLTAGDHGVSVIEDAAHAIGCSYRGQALGTIGDLGCLSFDGQKNVTCGEGGALLTSDQTLANRALDIQAKGTNRAAFLRGEVERYEWTGLGSSLLPSEIAAAYLSAQLESAEQMNARRRHNWGIYRDELEGLRASGELTLPKITDGCEHNGHIFYILLKEADRRASCLQALRARGVEALSHFVPLHCSPAGRRLGRVATEMTVTDSAAERLVRLPVHAGMTDDDLTYVVEVLHDALLSSS